MPAAQPMERFRIRARQKVHLDRLDPRDTSAFPGSKGAALRESAKLTESLRKLQELLYADHRHKMLVVLQGLDTAGKDGTIRHVFEGVNPQGVRVARFGPPNSEELAHDFLWRVHPQTPSNGEFVIFNRSHYEDVLIVRVDALAPKKVWLGRYREINDFERMLSENGTTILKFFFQISREEQRKRLQERLDDPTKHWKMSASDLTERRHWTKYGEAIEEMLERTSTAWAPWYLIPSDRKWFRDLAVSSILVGALGKLDLRWPPLPAEFKSTRIS